jgi:hypothetical protein
LGYEAIATAVHGLNKPRNPRFVAKRSAQLCNTSRRHRVNDADFSPEGVEQSVFGHQLTRVIEQIKEHIEGFAPQPYLLIA